MKDRLEPPAEGPAFQVTGIRFLLWVSLGVIGMSWGSTQLFSKLIVTAGHHPLGISLASTTLGALIITVVVLVTGTRLPLGRRHLIFYTICGITGTALPNVFSYAAIRELPVGIMSIVMATVPLMTFLAALIFRLDRPEWRRIAGLACGATAVLLLVVPDASLPDPKDAFWIGIAMITVTSYTAENIYIAKARPEECGPLQTICGLSWAAMLLLLPVTWASNTWMAFASFGTAELSLIAMTVLHLVAYGGFIWLIGRAGPVFAAQVGYVVTLFGVFLGIAILGEQHSAWVWISLALALVGLALVQPRT